MNNDEKILKAIEQQGKVLEALQTGQTRLEKTVTALQADVKSLKTDVSDVKQGQKEQGSAIARLEQGQEQTNKQLDQLTEDMADFFHKTWDKMDETDERVTIIEDHLGLENPHKN